MRVEITCPIYDKKIQKLLQLILDTQWADNVKARYWDGTLSNKRVKHKANQQRVRSQEKLHRIIARFEKSFLTEIKA
jgi:polyphosphate kinase